MTSTSGGVFIELAKYTLSIGGYVCGAIIDNNLEVCHILSNKLTDIEQMKKSKYVDSNIKDCFQEIKSLINKGIYVLFSGTPCQVAAIIQYIGRNKYLITCDFLCSGCSSPIVFKKYIHYLEDEYKSKLISFDFRTKSLCWVHPAFEIDFENEKVIIKHEDSAYYWLFANGASNKPCCSNCRYIENKISDITLGDCWGINENDKIYDEFGVSYININTQKGEEIFDEISMNFTYRELFNGEYPQYRQIHKPTDIVDKELFFRYIQNHNFLETTKIFLPWQYKENFISEKIRQIKKELFRRGFIK
ncbi:MAG: Coenzyme F420 hydrogenase/dehydrogenase, beta subunit C-terminal domain [Anaerorhabdus sp.]